MTGLDKLASGAWQDLPFLGASWPVTNPASRPETTAVAIRALLRVVITLLFLLVVLFIPAGTLRFWQGWVFLAVTIVALVCTVVYYLRRDPQALARRLFRREPLDAQRVIIFFIKILYVFTLILAGMDFRTGWTRDRCGALPWWVSAVAILVILGADIWFIKVLNANRFAASVIHVESGQTIAASGPYLLMRHPMYFGMIIRWLATPLALGSLVTFPAFCLIIPILAARLLLEEKFLERALPGYPEYCRQTRWRLIPFVW